MEAAPIEVPASAEASGAPELRRSFSSADLGAVEGATGQLGPSGTIMLDTPVGFVGDEAGEDPD
eukprot:7946649-Alexandrium_andersonii.AAC.1